LVSWDDLTHNLLDLIHRPRRLFDTTGPHPNVHFELSKTFFVQISLCHLQLKGRERLNKFFSRGQSYVGFPQTDWHRPEGSALL